MRVELWSSGLKPFQIRNDKGEINSLEQTNYNKTNDFHFISLVNKKYWADTEQHSCGGKRVIHPFFCLMFFLTKAIMLHLYNRRIMEIGQAIIVHTVIKKT